MDFYKVGPHELQDYERDDIPQDKYKWMVYWYKDEGYEGDGEAALLGHDGLIYYGYLGHCSCFGPIDALFHPMDNSKLLHFTPQDFIKDRDDIHDFSCKPEIMDQVKKLLEQDK